MKPTVFFCDDKICVSHWHNVQILDLAARMEVEHVAELERGYRSLLAAFPGGAIGFSIVPESVAISDGETREQSAKMLARFQSSVVLGVVIEGGGSGLRPFVPSCGVSLSFLDARA
jgi:hypothetical protein